MKPAARSDPIGGNLSRVNLASIPSPSTSVWHLGFLPLRAYAVCIVLGIIAAGYITERRMRARGAAPYAILDISVWAVPCGIIGARIYHVITSPAALFRQGRQPGRRVLHLAGRPRHLGRGRRRRVRSLGRRPPARDPVGRSSPTRSPPGSRSRRRSAVSATTSTTSCTVVARPCPGVCGCTRRWSTGRRCGRGSALPARPLPPDVPLRGDLGSRRRAAGLSCSIGSSSSVGAGPSRST